MHHTLDWTLCDPKGKPLSQPPPVEGSSVAIELNGRRTGELTIHFEDEAAGLVEARRTVLKCYRGEDVLLAGTVYTPSFRGRERRVVCPAWGPEWRLQQWYVGMHWYDAGDGIPPSGLIGEFASYDSSFTDQQSQKPAFTWAGDSEATILVDLVKYCNHNRETPDPNWPDPGIVIGNVPAPLPPVAGKSTSLIWGKQIWEAMRQLRPDVGDFDFRPVDREDGVFAAFDIYQPQMGTDRSSEIVLEFGWGQQNCSDFTYEPAGDQVSNVTQVAGQVPPYDPANPGHLTDPIVAYNETSRALYGEAYDVQSHPDLTSNDFLTRIAADQVGTYGYPIDFFKVTLAQDDGSGWFRDQSGAWHRHERKYGEPPSFGSGAESDFYLGDVIGVVARDRPGLDIETTGRVVAARQTQVKQAIAVELTIAPVIGGTSKIRGVTPPSFRKTIDRMAQALRMSQIA